MPSAHRRCGCKGCNAGHFLGFGNILAVCDTTKTSLGHQGKLPASLGSRGSRLDRRRRDPVTTGQCVAVDSVDHQGSARIINDYLFNFPDTNFAWSPCGIAGRRVRRHKRIAWLALLAIWPGRRGQRCRDPGGNTAAEKPKENLDSPCML